ncbi:hypothetical protein Aau02nite_80360 [Amorphoplanes auranticolor]|uniref:Uncharacterized protein n=1 Tax=Actinoplanes auranticolor TaxID=47988 RepID=A0A919VWG8_9ACTN|nr:hypothetical protein Aau02nite_80360 [Actinoplanes auranticolor]
MLLTAAAVLAVVHVIGVLFARPLYRPAEVLATLCLLACAIGSDLRADRGPARWGPTVAAAVLVAGAALTVPPPPGDGTGLQFLSVEQYDGSVLRTQLQSLIPVTVALLFVLVLLATGGKPRLSRTWLGAAIAAGVLVVFYTAARLALINSVLKETGPEGLPRLPPAVVALMPLLLALAALALAVVTAAQRRPLAAGGALLLVPAALIWIDTALGATLLPYEVYDTATLLSPDLITATDTLPQPTQALTAALCLTAAVLLIAGLRSAAAGPRAT